MSQIGKDTYEPMSADVTWEIQVKPKSRTFLVLRVWDEPTTRLRDRLRGRRTVRRREAFGAYYADTLVFEATRRTNSPGSCRVALAGPDAISRLVGAS